MLNKASAPPLPSSSLEGHIGKKNDKHTHNVCGGELNISPLFQCASNWNRKREEEKNIPFCLETWLETRAKQVYKMVKRKTKSGQRG